MGGNDRWAKPLLRATAAAKGYLHWAKPLRRATAAAKGDKKLRFTALLHDVKIDRLGSSYASLKSERRQKWMG